MDNSHDNNTQKTVVITGGNAGIGFETARIMAKRGWRVIITGRSATKLSEAVARIREEVNGHVDSRVGDFASFSSVRALGDELAGEPRIDVLLNNVGIASTTRETTEDGHHMVLQVNFLSHFLLTMLLLEKLKQSAPARIVNVASVFHRKARDYGFDDVEMKGMWLPATGSYARTKLYVVMFTRELAHRLEGTGVTVNAIHPGEIQTDIGDFSGILRFLWPIQRALFSPRESGWYVPYFAATSSTLDGVTGAYIHKDCKIQEPNPLALDADACAQLWALGERLTGIDTQAKADVGD